MQSTSYVCTSLRVSSFFFVIFLLLFFRNTYKQELICFRNQVNGYEAQRDLSIDFSKLSFYPKPIKKIGCLERDAILLFSMAYGLQGSQRISHHELVVGIMQDYHCSPRAVYALLYGFVFCYLFIISFFY